MERRHLLKVGTLAAVAPVALARPAEGKTHEVEIKSSDYTVSIEAPDGRVLPVVEGRLPPLDLNGWYTLVVMFKGQQVIAAEFSRFQMPSIEEIRRLNDLTPGV